MTDQCCISPAANEGLFLPCGTLLRVFQRDESEARSLPALCNEKLGNFSPPPPPPQFAPLYSSEWRVNFVPWPPLLGLSSRVSGFSQLHALYALDSVKQTATPVAKCIPNRDCHYFVSQQTEFTESVTRPTLISDLIINYHVKTHEA